MPAALDGVVVLDFTRLLPGPFCTQLLCNLGADVIKIEDPQLGDYMRAVPPTIDDTSYPFLMVNRGKRSLAVDLKTPEGQEILRRLARRADVVVEQFRPGVMTRLGVDYDGLAMMNPRLVYCSFSGYGQTGPYKDLPGHDINFEALAGILAVTGNRDDRRPAIPGVPIADLAAGFNAALAILAALRTDSTRPSRSSPRSARATRPGEASSSTSRSTTLPSSSWCSASRDSWRPEKSPWRGRRS